MCHYITMVLPATNQLSKLEAIAREHGKALTPQPNPSIEDQLRPGEQYFLTTKGHCDCGTTLGASARNRAGKRGNATWEEDAAKLRAKGWSATKVDRWLNEKQKSNEAQSKRSAIGEGSNIDWFDYLSALRCSGGVSYVGLLLHWYTGPLTGRIQLKDRISVSLADVGEPYLARIEEDVLYNVC